MTIREKIIQNWNLLNDDPGSITFRMKTLFPDYVTDVGEDLFENSFALVWKFFYEQLAKDKEKSTLVLVAPPYRYRTLLENVILSLIVKDVSPAEYMTPDEIRKAWHDRTQVIMCFKDRKQKIECCAYTPREDDINGECLAYHYDKGVATFNPDSAIILRASEHVPAKRPLAKYYICRRGADDHLFGTHGLLALQHPLIIVGNRCGETLSLLKNLKVG